MLVAAAAAVVSGESWSHLHNQQKNNVMLLVATTAPKLRLEICIILILHLQT